jgi:exonuclease SbcD
MRILHTSDWHLGKRLFRLDRSLEHEMFLDWMVKTLIDEKIDLLLIAGDIFDTPTPPHQSLETFYNFLHRLSVETNTQTLIIAGNHDSGLLLEAPSKILSSHRVKMWGKLSLTIEDHWMSVGNIDICALPFFRSYELLPQGGGDALEVLKKYMSKKKNKPQLLMLHHLAGVYEAAGSEQVIGLSGVDSIPSELLSEFDYVALGHIHKPQKIAPQIYYSGSPLPLRFSETALKSVVIIEVEGNILKPTIHPIPVFRKLITVKTNEIHYLKDLKKLETITGLTPMVEVQIELTSPKSGLIDEIKHHLNEKKMELLSYIPLYQMGEKKQLRSEKLFTLSTLELFEEFYSTKYPESKGMPEEIKKDFSDLLDKVKHAPHSP